MANLPAVVRSPPHRSSIVPSRSPFRERICLIFARSESLYRGILFGVPAGFLEEIGWMGFAFPKLRLHRSALSSSVILGVFWSVWHLPVIDYLGTAVPHGAYLPSFFVVFAVAMTAMRVLIAWVYANAKSVLMAQLMHVSSTGSLVIFSPPRVTARQEVMWYGLYGITLWIIVAIIITRRTAWRAAVD
jgi:uncharacterized protein